MAKREQSLHMIRTARGHLEGQLPRRLEVALLKEPLGPAGHRVECHGGDGGARFGAANLGHGRHSQAGRKG